MGNFKQLQRLMDIMSQLRDVEKGCPWDLQQDFKSLVSYTIEEVYELAEAIELNNETEISKELGDLLFHLVFYAQIGKEKQLFDLEKIAELISDKMIFRHPHVFSAHKYANQQEFEKDWLKRKQQEKNKDSNTITSLMDGISSSLPAMTRAIKIQKQAAHIGFDWNNSKHVLGKLKEEIAELEEEMDTFYGDENVETTTVEAINDELGDVLFSCVNLARHLKQDPETILRQANVKFSQRFKALERNFHFDHDKMEQCSLAELEKIWQELKNITKY